MTRARGAAEAYQVIAGSRPGESDLWDSGKVEGDACTQVEYTGGACARASGVVAGEDLGSGWDETHGRACRSSRWGC